MGGEDTAVVSAFIEQTGVEFPIFWDRGTYGAFAWPDAISPFPRQVLIDADGTVLYVASEHNAEALQGAIDAALER